MGKKASCGPTDSCPKFDIPNKTKKWRTPSKHKTEQKEVVLQSNQNVRNLGGGSGEVDYTMGSSGSGTGVEMRKGGVAAMIKLEKEATKQREYFKNKKK